MFHFDTQPLLLLTYAPQWSVESEVDGTFLVVKSVVNDLIESTQKSFDRNDLMRNIELCTELASEIINEIVEYVIPTAHNRHGFSPVCTPRTTSVVEPPQREISNVASHVSEDRVEVISEPMELSQDLPARNLHSEMAEDSIDSANIDRDPLSESSLEFEELWIKRKIDVEKCAEGRAKALFRQWQRDRTTLEQAIDTSLKEYGDMYEKAHALRLMFEEEKSQWSRKIMQVHDDDTPYGDMKRRRCDNEWPPQQPAWPYPQRQSLDNEFQYTADDSQDLDAAPMSASANRAVETDNYSAVISPQRRQTKKFMVPVKNAQEE